jgi:hypothetical protein
MLTKQSRITVRLTDEDRTAVEAIRRHLLAQKRWVTRADTIRFALDTAVRISAAQDATSPNS